jgi:hypothetical protein
MMTLDPREDDRVRRHTSAPVNLKIDRLTRAVIEDCATGGRDMIVTRLKELDREWDVDRALMANFAVIGGVTLALSERHHENWKYLFRAQLGFLLMHAVVGWCPPLPVFRRLGFRTAKEIGVERMALLELLETAPRPVS